MARRRPARMGLTPREVTHPPSREHQRVTIPDGMLHPRRYPKDEGVVSFTTVFNLSLSVGPPPCYDNTDEPPTHLPVERGRTLVVTRFVSGSRRFRDSSLALISPPLTSSVDQSSRRAVSLG